MFLIFKGNVLSATPMHLRGLREDRPPVGRMSERRINSVCRGRSGYGRANRIRNPGVMETRTWGRGELEPGKLSVS